MHARYAPGKWIRLRSEEWCRRRSCAPACNNADGYSCETSFFHKNSSALLYNTIYRFSQLLQTHKSGLVPQVLGLGGASFYTPAPSPPSCLPYFQVRTTDLIMEPDNNSPSGWNLAFFISFVFPI